MRTFLLSSTIVIIVSLFSPTALFAAADIGLKGIGPRLGYTDPEGGLDGTVEFGVDFELGTWVRQLHWDASATYWSSGQEYRYVNTKFDWSVSDFAVRTGVNYHFVEGEFEPYAGGGIGIHFYSWDYANYNGPAIDNSDSDLGFYINGGVEYKFSPKWVGDAIVRFDIGDPDQTALVLQLIHVLGN